MQNHLPTNFLFILQEISSCLSALYLYLTMKEQLMEGDNPTTLDDLMDKKIGFGQAQQNLIRPVYLLYLAEGCQVVVLGLLLPELGQQWNLQTFEKSFLITVVYIGVCFGSFFQTWSDKYGRHRFLVLDAIAIALFGLLSPICASFYQFATVRFFYGVGMGITFPLSATYIAEIVPSYKRAQIIANTWIYWSIGSIGTCILCWMFLRGHHWRILLILVSLPGLYAAYDLIKNGQQSIRYLWVHKRTNQAVEIIDRFTLMNGRTTIPREKLITLISHQQAKEQQKIAVRELFCQKYMKITLIIGFTWFSIFFLYYSLILLTPTIIFRHEELSFNFHYLFLIMVSAVEFISLFLARYFMDHPNFGRKRSLYLSYIGMLVLSSIITIEAQQNIYIALIALLLLKILTSSGTMFLYPYSAQLYDIIIRSTAMGTFSICGRIATIIMGIIGISALDWAGGLGLYIIFILMCLCTSVLLYRLPYDTLGRKLDT